MGLKDVGFGGPIRAPFRIAVGAPVGLVSGCQGPFQVPGEVVCFLFCFACMHVLEWTCMSVYVCVCVQC